ncbi:SDR family oxidoreductase [soil metagenome]
MIHSFSSDRVLITGATAGIGAEFARQLAATGAELVLVARDTARLTAMSRELNDAEVLTADLLTPAGVAAVTARLAASVDPVTMLINNAGYGLAGEFDANDIEAEMTRHRLLVDVPMRLSHAALQRMLPAAHGIIVNVASVAGFTPRGSYGAAKAWVLNFSRWANHYYRARGVTVTAVAPGFVHTEFHDRAKVDPAHIPGWMWLDAPFLVRSALRDIARGKSVSVPSVRYKLITFLTRFLPDSVVAAGAVTGRR